MTNFHITPVGGTLGAEISGVALGPDLSADTVAALRAALLEHKVLFFRDQSLAPEDLTGFAAHFGPLDHHPYVDPMEGHPAIIEIVKEPEDHKNFGGIWHSDMPYNPVPPLGSVLYGIDIPDHGGDTIFADMNAAYRALSPGLRRMLDGMTAINSATKRFGDGGGTARYDGDIRSIQLRNTDKAQEIAEHPVVRAHPETGLPGLYVNPAHTMGFKDMTEAESAPLLDFLYQHMIRPEFTCRFRWRPGSVAMWDNRITQHYAINDYHGQRRRMWRVTIQGDRPAGLAQTARAA